jgi:hypothetical protein
MTPEYSLEIITTDRNYVLVPFNEDQHKRWLQLLIEAMDAYGDTKLSMTHMRDGSGVRTRPRSAEMEERG